MTGMTTPTPGWLLEVGGASPGALPRCQAVVLACIDVRFVEPLRSVLESQGLTGGYDLVAWPGGALALTTAEPLARALLKLEQAAKAIPMAVQPAQASKYIVNPLTGRRANFARFFTTHHPPTEQRVARLRQPVTGARP